MTPQAAASVDAAEVPGQLRGELFPVAKDASTDRIVFKGADTGLLKPCSYIAPLDPLYATADHGPVVAMFGLDLQR